MRFVLCAPPSCKCPVLTKNESGYWELTDDYENKVILTDENLVCLQSTLNSKIFTQKEKGELKDVY